MRSILIVCCLLALVVSTALRGSQADDDVCDGYDYTHTQACLDGFYDAFQVSYKNLPPFATYDAAVQSTMRAFGANGVWILCSYVNTAIDCVGRHDMLNACTKPLNYQTMYNVSVADSRSYAADLKVKEYQCTGANQAVLTNNQDCLLSAVGNTSLIGSCQGILREGDCMTYQMYEHCVQGVVTAVCGQAVSKLVCNSVSLSLTYLDGNCTLPVC